MKRRAYAKSRDANEPDTQCGLNAGEALMLIVGKRVVMFN